jgi:hypothetical protein
MKQNVCLPPKPRSTTSSPKRSRCQPNSSSTAPSPQHQPQCSISPLSPQWAYRGPLPPSPQDSAVQSHRRPTTAPRHRNNGSTRPCLLHPQDYRNGRLQARLAMEDHRTSIPRALRRLRGSSSRAWRCRLGLEGRCRRVDRCHLLALGGWDLLVFRRSSRHRRDMVGGEAVEERRRFILAQMKRMKRNWGWIYQEGKRGRKEAFGVRAFMAFRGSNESK